MEDVFYYNELYDLYNSLLTDKQKEYYEGYYFNDLSLSEMVNDIMTVEIEKVDIFLKKQIKNEERKLEE